MGVVPVCDDIISSNIHWLWILPNFVDLIIITLCGSVCICIISLIQRLIVTCITKTLHRIEDLWLLHTVKKIHPCKKCAGCVCLFTEKQQLWHQQKQSTLLRNKTSMQTAQDQLDSTICQRKEHHYAVVLMASSTLSSFLCSWICSICTRIPNI